MNNAYRSLIGIHQPRKVRITSHKVLRNVCCSLRKKQRFCMDCFLGGGYIEMNDTRMAAAARNCIAVPTSGVIVERLLDGGEDILSVRQCPLNSEAMRRVVLVRDAYKSGAPR